MNRERAAWLVSVVLLSILVFQLPGTFGQRDDDYNWVRTLVEVHRQILENYGDPVDDASLKEKSIEGMIGALDDPFTNYIPPEHEAEFDKVLGGSFSGVGISLRVKNGKMIVASPVEGGPADRAGVDSGDEIVKVDGKAIAGVPIEEVVKRVGGPLGSPVTLTVLREGKEIDLTMNRQKIQLPTVKGYNRLQDQSWNYWICQNPKTAYIRITQFDENAFDELNGILTGSGSKPGLMNSGMQGLILDLRFNPGGQLQQAIKVVNLFLKSGVIVTTRGRNSPEEIDRADGEGTLPYFPMIVLVNDQSASAAEIVSGSLKDNHRALIVGQRTYGKGSVQRVVPLGDNDGSLKITVAHWYLPSGRLVSRKKDSKDWGVEPQVIVPMTEDGEESIRDLMERQDAIRYHAPATTNPTSQPTTQPTDPQFDQALTTMVGLIILDNNQKTSTTQPTTQRIKSENATTAPANQ